MTFLFFSRSCFSFLEISNFKITILSFFIIRLISAFQFLSPKISIKNTEAKLVKTLLKLICLLLVLSITKTDCLWAVGASAFSTQMVGTKALGQGNAFVAQADDPSAVYFNPAGILQLEGAQLSIGSNFLLPNIKRSGEGVSEDKMKSQISAVPNLYFTGHLPSTKKRIAYGIGLTSPYGLTTEWSPSSSVRYVTTISQFELVNVNPSIATELSSSLTFGFGINYVNLFNVTSKSQTNLSAANADSSSDGTSELTGDGDGWGYNFGFLFKPLKQHSFGLSYRSKTHIAIDGELKLTNLSASTQLNYNFPNSEYSSHAKSDVTLPDSIILGYAFKPTDKLTFLMDYEWTRWSVFKNQDVTISESDSTRLGFLTGDPNSNTARTKREWKDVSALGLGANFKLNEDWQIRGGYGYFEKSVPNRTFSPDVPDASSHLLTAGFTKDWSSFIFDFAFNEWIYSRRNINNTVGNSAGASVNGTYKAYIPSVSANFTYKW